MGDKFVLPIGIDGENLINPLNTSIDTLEKLQSTSKDTGQALNDAFTKGASAIDKVDDKLKPMTKNLDAVKALGKQVGKELATAFSDKNLDPSKLEKAVASFKQRLESIQKVEINVDADPKKMQMFERQLESATNAMEMLQIAAAATQEVMSQLDPNSAEYQQAAENITFLETAMQEYATQVGGVTEKQKSLKAQLKEMKQALAEMELAGQAGSQGYRDMLKAAGELEDQIGDTNAQIKAMASDTQMFDALISGAQGLTGAFAAVQGAAGLFGDENKDLEKALLKVNSAMAILQGLQAVAETLNKDSALSVLLLSKARTADAVATSEQTAAEAVHTATIAAETVAAEALVAAQTQETIATAAATAASEAHAIANTEETAAALAAAVAAQSEAVALTQEAEATLASASASRANAAAQVMQATAMEGATVATKLLRIGLASIGIGLIIALIAYLIANWDKLKASMQKMLPATKDMGKAWDEIKAIFVGVGTALVEYIIAPFKIAIALITDGLDAAVEQAKESYNVIDNYNKGHQQQTVQNAINHAMDMKKVRMEQWESQLKIQEAEGLDTYKSRVKWYKNKIAIARQEGEDTKDIEQELAEFQARKRGENRKAAEDAAKKAAADAKKAAEDAKKKREEEAKKAAEFNKQQAELVTKYTREINKIRIDAMDEGLEKTKAKLDEEAKVKIEDLKKEEAKTKEAIAKRAELIKAIEDENTRQKKEAEKKAQEERLQLQIEGQEMLLKMQEENLNASLELSRLDHEKKLREIEEQYKNEGDLKIELLKAEDERYKREQEKIRIDDKQKTINLEEEKAILVIELMEKYGNQSVKTEKQKQLAILQVKLEAAEKSLKLLTDSGKTENDVEVLKAKKLVKDMKDAIKSEAESGNKFDMMEFLGIGGNWDDKKKENFKKAVNESMKVLGDFTSFMIDNYNQQIDAKQKQIDQTQSEIDDLESRLDKEKELKEQGFANDVDLIQQELDAKKEQKAEQIRQEQELLDKKKQMQKVQLALDTVSQLSGLITASVDIYKGFATIPIVGIPLAIAMIGLMFGTFAASKIKAAQMINQQSAASYGDGGEIDGNPHSMGGVKYYSKDGKNVRELEGGEYVTKKTSYAKYKALVQAINNDDFSGLNIQEIAAMGLFQKMGVTYIPDSIVDAVDDTRAIRSFGGGETPTDHLKNIDDNVEFIANSKKDEVSFVETESHTIRKRGTRTTLTRKQ